MSPHEQAGPLALSWCLAWPGDCDTKPYAPCQKHMAMADAALAASAAKEPSMNVAQEIYELKREREEDRAAIRALHAVVETIRMQVSAEYLAPLACFDDVKTHAPAIQRATQAPA